MRFVSLFLDFAPIFYAKLKMKRRKSSGVIHSGRKYRNDLYFRIIALLLPVALFAIVEIVLRLVDYGDNFNLFVRNPEKGYENYLIVNPQIGKKYFQKFEYTDPANDIFLEHKPANAFRVFVMGSSTVFGFPYERNLMFSRMLHQRLEAAYPDKKIEVVNTSITAINSFTLLDFTSQILENQPDAILIYAGHNEFYGAFGVGSNETMSKSRPLTQLHIYLMDFKIYQLLKNFIASFSKVIASNENEVHGTLMKRMVGNKDIVYGSEAYEIGITRYRQNMDAILKKAADKKVPVFFSELVSNVSGMEPFNSVATGTQEAAKDVFAKAKRAEAEGRFDEASELYFKAKDLDCIRFRASENINEIIKELAEKHKAYKVPMLSVFRKHSLNGLIGNNLMTEHLHPNIEGNFLMAEAFYQEIVESGLAGKISENAIPSFEYQKLNWGYTVLDSLLGAHRVQQLKGFWPFITDQSKEYNYKNVYRPKSAVDSLAFSKIRNPKLSVAGIRLNLAQRYEKNGQLVSAYKEYEALLRMNPYVAVNYRDAANCLLQLGDLPLALKYLQKSLDYEPSFFATFRIAEILFMKGDYENAVIQFEKAFALAPDDKKLNVLVKSYYAFVYSGKASQAKAVAEELKKAGAERYLTIPEKKYMYTQYVPFQTKSQVETARKLISEGKYSEAIQLLENSLQVYLSPVAERLIAETALLMNNIEKAELYFDGVNDEFRFDPAFQHQLILLYLSKNEIEAAQKSFTELKRLDSGYTVIDELEELIKNKN